MDNNQLDIIDESDYPRLIDLYYMLEMQHMLMKLLYNTRKREDLKCM